MSEDIKIKFLGGAGEVGRSAFLIDAGDKILLEYGVKLSPLGIDYPEPFNVNLDCVIISHAHLDHSGNLPYLFHQANSLTYMTPPTLELADLLWEDTLKIAGYEGIEAKFTREEISRVHKYTFPVGYRKPMEITKNTSMEFFDAGHIVGSAMTKIKMKNGKSLVYTGDLKVNETRLHNGADLDGIGEADYLIIESTYGDRDQPPRKEIEKEFIEEVQNTLDKGGHALISCFAVGRSQEIIDILHEYNLEAPMFLDGMAQKASKTYLKYPEYLKDANFLRKALSDVNWVKKMSVRKKALKEPSIIVTTSGMLEGGPVFAYLPELYKDKKSTLFLTGYQVEETAGRKLLDTGVINLQGLDVKLEMKYKQFSFSAHADQSELFKTIERINPEKVICVHGDKENMQKMAREVKQKGFETFTPDIGDGIIL